MGCTAVKPVVDRLEQEFTGKLLVIRLNIQDDLGKQLAPIYGFQYTPTFIFFDEQGREQWRTVGSFDEDRLRQELANR
jgi:thiol-disulfide isomerase/thioredoxin